MTKTTAPKLAFYLRVSTNKQDAKSQMLALVEYCRRHGWTVAATSLIFSEKVSALKTKRTELDRLLQATRAGLVDTVLTYRVDRVGRSMLHLVNLLAELKRNRIRVVGVADNFDNADTSPDAVFRQNLLVSLAELERGRIVERTFAGLAAARRAGRIGGRRRVSDAKIAEAWTLRAKNPPVSLRSIAATVGLSPSYLSRVFAKTPPPGVAQTSPQKNGNFAGGKKSVA